MTASRPSIHCGIGGIAKVALSTSIATIASMSRLSHALTYAHELAQPVVPQLARGLLLAARRSRSSTVSRGSLDRAVDRRRRSCRASRRPRAAEKPSTSRRTSDRALVGGQVLQRGDEGELDALALLVARLGCRSSALDAERFVRLRLEPDSSSTGAPGPVAGRRRRAVVDRQHPLRTLLERVEAYVRRDPVEPGAERASGLESREAAPCPQQHLLQGVVGIVRRAEHPVAVGVQLAAVRLDQLRRRSARCRLPQQPGLCLPSVASTLIRRVLIAGRSRRRR